MTNKFHALARTLILIALSLVNAQVSTALAQGAAFTYQGLLLSNNVPLTGSFDFQFSLYNAAQGGAQVGATLDQSAIGVTNGLFTTTLDFGATFPGAGRWLALSVRSVNSGPYTALTPLQSLAPTPYAIYSENTGSLTASATIPAAQITGAIADAPTPSTLVLRDASGDITASSFDGSGSNLTSLNAEQLTVSPANILNQNFFAGITAGNTNDAAARNTAVGFYALSQREYGADNTATGFQALAANITGYGNTATGSQALGNNNGGEENTANGVQALLHNTAGYYNTALGAYALYQNTNGVDNTATGSYALYANSSGSNNTVIGFQAMIENDTGSSNTATGFGALSGNINGFDNSAFGVNALAGNLSGYNDVAFGFNSLLFGNEVNDVAIGVDALQNVNFSGQNTALGSYSFQHLTDGSGNIGLGDHSGLNLETGDNNIYLGNPGAASESDCIRIGNTQTNAYISGIFGVTSSDGEAVYVNADGQLGTKTSSALFKTDIQGMADASDVLLALRPVTFKYKPELDPKGVPQFGLVAEEVAQLDPDLVARDRNGKVNSVRYDAVNAMLLNEFLKEHEKVQTLETRLAHLENLVQQLADKQSVAQR